MVSIKDEPKDYVSISYHDDSNQIKFEKNTSNMGNIICKICQTYFSDWRSLRHHLEDCYRRYRRHVYRQILTSSETFDERALTNESPSTYTNILNERNFQERISEKSRVHKCRFCKMRYKFPAELRYHILTHTTVKHYVCSYCENKFDLSRRSKCERTQSRHSRKHIYQKTGDKTSDFLKTERRFDCSVNVKFKKSATYKKPPKSYHRQKSLMNRNCIITSKKSLQLHCSSRFVDYDLGRHARTHTSENLYECSHYSKRFTQLGHLKPHKLAHTGEKPYHCSDCSKHFTTFRGLTIHKRIHTGEKPYECSHCSKRFTSSRSLTIHKRIHTGEKPYGCSHCSKRFSIQHVLTEHIRTHTGEKPYQCPYCSKRFTQHSHLKSHKLTHTGEKPYECSDCGKRYTTSRDLSRHKSSHTGEKPYQCSHCDKRFTQLEHLKRHTLSHTGEKPYQCSHCSKRFMRPDILKIHERTHTGEKPYECPHCSKRFNHLGNLNKHKSTHIDEKL